MLAEQRSDMLALWREAWVERRRDQHLDHRLRRPAIQRGIGKGAVHIIHARRHDDSGGEVVAAARLHGKTGQLVERDIHSERGAFAAPVREMLLDRAADGTLRHQSIEQELGVHACGNGWRAPTLAARYDARGAALFDDNLADW